MKNPPVFARQANIAQGPQQVNNGVVNNGSAHAGLPESSPNKLLEANGERLDVNPAPATVESDPPLAPVGARNRATQP
jgi:hypothetical protein